MDLSMKGTEKTEDEGPSGEESSSPHNELQYNVKTRSSLRVREKTYVRPESYEQNDCSVKPCHNELMEECEANSVKNIEVQKSSTLISNNDGSSLLHTLGVKKTGVEYTNINPVANLLATLNNTATIASPKTLPLLVNMKGAQAAAAQPTVPSILPANLPPGRYVIISSTTAPTTTSTQSYSVTTPSNLQTTATSLVMSIPSSNRTIVNNTTSCEDTYKQISSNTSCKKVRNSVPALLDNSPSPSAESQPQETVKTPVGKTRGMRKSYTASEKLAMIEAVESGLKKSVVADRFGVAPSTLACIILQKEKIRRDQSYRSNAVLNKRRIRPSLLSRKQFLESKQASKDENSKTKSSPRNDSNDLDTTSTPPLLLQSQPVLNPYPIGSFGAMNNVLSNSPLLGGTETINRNVLPFTHFLANFDQSFGFDSRPEELMPDFANVQSNYSEDTENSGQEEYGTRIHNGLLNGCDRMQGVRPREAVNLPNPDDGRKDLSTTHSTDTTQHSSSNIQEPNIEIDTNLPTEHSGESGSKNDDTDSHTLLPDGSTDAELSGLCLVKRQIHCYSVLDQLMRDDTYTDVTISTDGHTFKAHKIVLCMASNYFKRVLNDNTPGVRNVIVLRDITTTEMKNVLQFIYTGEATLDASDLQSFMKTAQLLEINSLCDNVPQIPKTSSNRSSSDDIQAFSNHQFKTTIPTSLPSHPSSLSEVPQLTVPPIPNGDSFPSTLFQPQYQYYIQQHLKRRIEAFARQTLENNIFDNGYINNIDTSNGNCGTENDSPLPLTCKMKNTETKDSDTTLGKIKDETVENEISDKQNSEEKEDATPKDEIKEPEHKDQLTEENCLENEITDSTSKTEESIVREEDSPPSKKRKIIPDD